MNATVYRPEWTPERTEELVRLVRNGLSAQQIADRMGNGLTRSAVSGRISRLRNKTNDDTMRPGYSAGRFYHPPADPNAAKAKQRSGWAAWREKRNAGSVVSAMKFAAARANGDRNPYWDKRERKVQRRLAMLNLKDYPNAVHILERNEYTRYSGAAMGVAIIQYAQCPWPIWNDDDSFSERFMCGNPKEDGCHYCTAHLGLAHDVRLPGQFNRKPGFINKWTATLTVLRGRAA